MHDPGFTVVAILTSTGKLAPSGDRSSMYPGESAPGQSPAVTLHVCASLLHDPGKLLNS